MVRTFDTLVKCPTCGHSHTAESAFERWMRDNPALDPRMAGIVRFDCDILLHKFMTYEDKRGIRDVQGLMFIEVKCFGAGLRDAQRDTLSMLSQVLRNRKANMHSQKRGPHATDHIPPAKTFSKMFNRWVEMRMFGGHLLQLETDDPVTSNWMMWDNKKIDIELLTQILRFEIDPDTLGKIDLRRHHKLTKKECRQLALVFGTT